MLFSMGALCCVVAIWCADAAVTRVVTVDEARFQTFSALSRRVHGVPAVAGCAPHLLLGHLQRPRAEGTKWSLFPGDQDRGSSKKQKIAFCERFWFFLSPKNQRERETRGVRIDSPNKQYNDGWTPSIRLRFQDVSIRCHWGTICRRSGAPDRTWLTTEPEDVHVKLLLQRGRRIGDRRVGARKRSEHTRAHCCAKYTL